MLDFYNIIVSKLDVRFNDDHSSSRDIHDTPVLLRLVE